MEDIEALKVQTITQQQELNAYEEIEEDLKNKLEELKGIESQLKSRLSSEVQTKTPTTITLTSSHINFLEVNEQIKNLYSLIASYDKKVSEQTRIPNVLPCAGRISSYFGMRTNPVSRGKSETHHGVDITNSYKTPIKASADGVVEYAGWLNGYGYAVIINHQNGYKSVYGHNSKLLVKKSQSIKRGQVISLMGSTGRSTGTHVHFEVRLNGIPINPLKITKGGNL
jgi:murein DD-endopeptidase MepM/ murein hydrolase activator NlpD